MIDVVAVSKRRTRRDFVDVPKHVYANDPHYVARLNFEMMHHTSSKNPYFAHATHQLFVAYEHGKPVGRISAQIDALAQSDGVGTLGHFGFLDAARPGIVPHLFAAAEAWLRARGATRIAGPYSFSTNDEAGLLVEGFDSAPYLLNEPCTRVDGVGGRSPRLCPSQGFARFSHGYGNALSARRDATGRAGAYHRRA